MIKVLHITGLMNRGGAEVMLMDLYRNMPEGFHFDFLINYKLNAGIKEGDFDEEIKRRGGNIYHIPTQWDLGPVKYLNEFRKILEKNGMPDLVHIHLNAKSGFIAWAAKKLGIKKVIVHAHADLKFRGSILSRTFAYTELFFQKILISKNADRFWGCSKEANESLFYSGKLTNENSVIINNAVDVEAYQNLNQKDISELKSSYGFHSGNKILGNIGRVVSHKNVLFIIDILHELKKRGEDYVFVFAGRADQPDYLENIFNKIKEYGLEESVKYLGLREDVPAVIHTFDVFVGPALKEGFGLVAVEAQVAGVPAVLYKGFPKSVDMNLNLIEFLENFDPESWVKAILQAPKPIRNKEMIREQIIRLGFDSQSNAKEVENLYRKILNEG